jgi:hypothetical protein
MNVTVISYNMSVFSAMGYYGDMVKSSSGNPAKNDAPGFYPSEARFLRRAKTPLDFFNNSLNHLVENVKEKMPAMIGIQEFHHPTLDIIMTAMNEVNTSYTAVPFRKNITNSAKVLTIFDSSILGDLEGEYHEDIGLTPGLNLPPGDKGRPISILFTSKGYTLINFHGINRPRLSPEPVDVAPILKEALQIHLSATPFADKINPAKIIITCDSNDRAHKINIDDPLILNGMSFHDGHSEDDIVKSCCYNYDSCGIDEAPANAKNPQTMGDRGAESRYAYAGDYVLANSFVTPVMAVDSPQDADGASIASDHKLVYAVIKLPFTGGKRKNKQKTQKSRKQRKSRRTYKK